MDRLESLAPTFSSPNVSSRDVFLSTRCCKQKERRNQALPGGEDAAAACPGSGTFILLFKLGNRRGGRVACKQKDAVPQGERLAYGPVALRQGQGVAQLSRCSATHLIVQVDAWNAQPLQGTLHALPHVLLLAIGTHAAGTKGHAKLGQAGANASVHNAQRSCRAGELPAEQQSQALLHLGGDLVIVPATLDGLACTVEHPAG